MSTESLFGGTVDLETTLNQESIDLLNSFLIDTVGGSAIRVTFDDEAILLVASGDSGEKQGVLLPDDDDEVQGTLNDGVIRLDLQLPEDVGMMFEGEDNITPAAVGVYLREQIEAYLPAGENDALRNSLLNAVEDLLDTLEGMGSTIAVRLIEFLGADGTSTAAMPQGAVGLPNEVIWDANGTGAETLFAFNLANLADTQTLVVKNANNVAIAGSGSVRVDGTGAFVTSDSASQTIVGGTGNDTLMGGGGSDTLTGGAGGDVFGFDFVTGVGNYTVTDFSVGTDKIGIDMTGVTTFDQVKALVTGVSVAQTGVTYYFANNVSVTLVGLTPDQITAALFQFDI
jgi:Ca2+-binding RTX toxin-like protein